MLLSNFLIVATARLDLPRLGRPAIGFAGLMRPAHEHPCIAPLSLQILEMLVFRDVAPPRLLLGLWAAPRCLARIAFAKFGSPPRVALYFGISSYTARKEQQISTQTERLPETPVCLTTMDYARDNVGLAEGDLENVFKYAPRESTVVEMLGGARVSARISPSNDATRPRS